MLQDFKKFVMKGNVLDLAVAVVLGGAFGAIITSLVNNVIMPPIGLLAGHVDFANLFINLSGKPFASVAAARAAGAPVIAYGLFVNAVINFLIVALAVFLLVRQVSRFMPKPPAPPAAPPVKDCPFCFTSIPAKATRCPNCTSTLG